MNDKDDTLKLIDKISEVLSYLLELKKHGQFQSGVELIDETLESYFDFDTSSKNVVSEQFLNDVISDSKKLKPQVINSLGDLLNEKGDLLYSQNKLKESKEILKNALTIYFFLNDNQDFFSFERMNKMVMINDKLSEIDLKIDDQN
jgi:hypothetical protein